LKTQPNWKLLAAPGIVYYQDSIQDNCLFFLGLHLTCMLPTSVNLRRWHIQCGARCALCDSPCPTTAHVLSGCLVALSQNRYIYRHNLVLRCLVSQFSSIFNSLPLIRVYANLQNLRASESPPATIPPSVMVTPCRPDLVIYNTVTNSISQLELTCPLDSEHHLQPARFVNRTRRNTNNCWQNWTA